MRWAGCDIALQAHSAARLGPGTHFDPGNRSGPGARAPVVYPTRTCSVLRCRFGIVIRRLRLRVSVEAKIVGVDFAVVAVVVAVVVAAAAAAAAAGVVF